MRTVYPHYYHDFSCIADKCPDTCCAGWLIMIDEESMERYEQYVGSFSGRLEKGIDFNRGCFKQDEQKRCSMLNKDNLCDMILHMGENHLCKTCKLYPRHVEEFEGLREWSLSLSCPVAAHIVLSCKEPVRFLTTSNEDDDPLIDEFDDFDFLLFTELEDARDVIYQIIQDRSQSVELRMQGILSLGRTLQTCVEENRISDMQGIVSTYKKDWTSAFDPEENREVTDPVSRYDLLQETFSVFEKLELLREDWKEILDKERDMLAKGAESYANLRKDFVKEMEEKEFWPVFLENYLMSFIYTYFCGAVYDDWIDSKVMLGVFSLLFTEEFIMNRYHETGKITLEDCENIACRYVREVEHSDLNLNTLEEYLHAVLFSPA